MNIDSPSINSTTDSIQQVNKSTSQNDSSASFSDELKNLNTKEAEGKTDENISDENTSTKSSEKNNDFQQSEIATDELASTIKKINLLDETITNKLKNTDKIDDKDNESELNMVNGNYNIQDNSDMLPQMSPNMNFAGNGQPFASFMNDSNDNSKQDELGNNAKEIAEEQAILSTMAENVAIANKRIQSKEQNQGIKELKSINNQFAGQEQVVSDNIIMNRADVEVFANLVNGNDMNLENLTQNINKSVQISKTLADALLRAKENGTPLRIDFDNDISVIIKISRDGKISADFLPSSQVAEAYLKENLPLLRQRFDEQNINYNELNQRNQRENQNNKKKGQKNE
ncbi:MAG: flagellar hook-length control protein FliK [bacterium]|nr:flagellar hook-length control protein FliK [bacterium]